MRTSTLHVLLFAGLVGAATLAGATPRFVCYTVRPGDTASRMALRLMGDIDGRHDARFQILDPVALRFIPKAAYTHIQPGWQACVQQDVIFHAPDVDRTYNSASLIDGLGWWWLTFLCVGSLVAWMTAQNIVDRRQATARALDAYGRAFVREFERPLRHSGTPSAAATPALRSQLTLHPQRGQLEVLVAPGDGHRYPNLADHRRNVEYDILRIMQALDDRRFVCGRLDARGPWIVIPFRFEPRLPPRVRLGAPDTEGR
jgi:hypothetical protein